MAATVTISSGATWQEVAIDRQKYRDSTLKNVDPPLPTTLPGSKTNTTSIAKTILTSEEIKITETLVENLVIQLAKSQMSSVTVVKAFLRRAALAQQLV